MNFHKRWRVRQLNDTYVGVVCQLFYGDYQIDPWRGCGWSKIGKNDARVRAEQAASSRVRRTELVVRKLERRGFLGSDALDRVLADGYKGRRAGDDFSVITMNGEWAGFWRGSVLTGHSFESLIRRLP